MEEMNIKITFSPPDLGVKNVGQGMDLAYGPPAPEGVQLAAQTTDDMAPPPDIQGVAYAGNNLSAPAPPLMSPGGNVGMQGEFADIAPPRTGEMVSGTPGMSDEDILPPVFESEKQAEDKKSSPKPSSRKK